MTRDERKHLARVAELGCILCGMPAEIHHVRRDGGKRDHMHVIPLCPMHHRAGNYRTAIHAGRVGFEQRHGTEAELLARVRSALAGW